MSLRQAASLSIVAFMSATGVLADVRGVRSPPSFTSQEIELIGRDKRLVDATRRCAWQLRQALDLLGDTGLDSRVGVRLEPCIVGSDGRERASDEGALDILKILKEASEQGTSRMGRGAAAGSTAMRDSPSFTSEEMQLIYRDRKLVRSLQHCAWQLRQALDSLHHAPRSGQAPRPCRLPADESIRGTDEGALDILKILREASGESTSN
jgi:hypothetical protein